MGRIVCAPSHTIFVVSQLKFRMNCKIITTRSALNALKLKADKWARGPGAQFNSTMSVSPISPRKSPTPNRRRDDRRVPAKAA